jgi:hypothetical protein
VLKTKSFAALCYKILKIKIKSRLLASHFTNFSRHKNIHGTVPVPTANLSSPDKAPYIIPTLNAFRPLKHSYFAQMSDSEDEDLRRAIALSLQESSLPSKQQNDVVDLISSDEDDDLDAPCRSRSKEVLNQSTQRNGTALAAIPSQHQTEPERLANNSHGLTEDSAQPTDTRNSASMSQASDPQLSSSKSTFLGLDRKQMEQDRMKRIEERKKREATLATEDDQSRKRKASTSAKVTETNRQVRPKYSSSSDQNGPSIEVPDSKYSNGDEPTPKVLSFKNHSTVPSRPIIAIQKGNDQLVNSQPPGNSTGICFPDGVVKKTWAYGYPRQDDIKIEEIFQKETLELAVLSAFQVDPEWVETKLKPNTKVIWVLQAKTEAEVSLIHPAKKNFVAGRQSYLK